MSALHDSPRFGPFRFVLTEQEARVASSRGALRNALSGGLTLGHLAPLVAFLLAMAFMAILALTDLISRRAGEIGILLAASAFMIHRIMMRRRFMRAQRDSVNAMRALSDAGELEARFDDAGVSIDTASRPARWLFAEVIDVDDAGELIYLWPKSGPPAILPKRIFSNSDEANSFTTFARARRRRSTI